MRLQVKGKNVEVSDTIRRYAEEKMHKLDRQLHELAEVELELRVEKNPSIADNQVAEVTVWTKGPTLRGKRRKDWHVRDNGIPSGGSMSIPEEEDTGEQIVKVKQFSVKPMSPEEAVLQLELIGHDFFVFRSDESGDINVIYRRRNGGYGLIEPQG